VFRPFHRRVLALLVLVWIALLVTGCGGHPAASPPAAGAAPARSQDLTPLQAAYQFLEDLYADQTLPGLPPDLRSQIGGQVGVDDIDRAWNVRGVTRVEVEHTTGQRSARGINEMPPAAVEFRVFETTDAAHAYFDHAEEFAVRRFQARVGDHFVLSDSRYPATCITATSPRFPGLVAAGCAVVVDTVVVQGTWLPMEGVSLTPEEGAGLITRLGVEHLEARRDAAARRAATPPTRPVLRVGWIASTPFAGPGSRGPFLARMEQLGYHRGQDFFLDYRFADNEPERLPSLAAELVSDHVGQLVAVDVAAARAARRATSTIPIVILGSQDPVAEGLAASVTHPGGNVTGMLVQDPPEIYGKRLDIMADAFPDRRRVAVIGDRFDGPGWDDVERVARARGIELVRAPLGSPPDVEQALATVVQAGARAVLEFHGNVANWNRYQRFQAEQHLPFLYDGQNDAAGVSYAGNPQARFARAADFVDRIRQGASPADLPFERVQSYLLLIDLSDARAWGFEIAPTVVAQADNIWDDGWVRP
jgi:putative ABC transport system substrate-binding protein